MLSQKITSQVLRGPDGHRIHHFGESSTPVFRARAMDVIDREEEGYVRIWIEKKGRYGYKWRTNTGELLDNKPEILN